MRLMTQEDRWLERYNELREYIERNHRRPSKYNLDERNSWNWLRHNQKLYNNGEMTPERIERFEKLLALCEQNRRKNQYE